MKVLENAFFSDSEFIRAAESCNNNHYPVLINGVCDVARHVFCGALAKKLNKKALIIVHDDKQAYKIKNLLEEAGYSSLMFPSRDFLFEEIDAHSREYEQERLLTLIKLSGGEFDFALAVPDAIMQYTLPPAKLMSLVLKITVGQKLSIESLVGSLLRLGYSQSDTVEGKGQFSRRGGIIDVFSPGGDFPCRVDFFGDFPDSMGLFDTITQRKVQKVISYDCLPVTELLAGENELKLVKDAVLSLSEKPGIREKVKEELSRSADELDSGVLPGAADRFFTALIGGKATVFDYLGEHITFIIESRRVLERARVFAWETHETLLPLVEAGKTTFALADVHLSEEDFASQISKNGVALDYFVESSRLDFKSRFSLTTKSLGRISGGASSLAEELGGWLAAGRETVYFALGEREAQNLSEVLADKNIPFVSLAEKPQKGLVNIGVMNGNYLPGGFENPGAGVVFLTSAAENAGQMGDGTPFRRKRSSGIIKKAEKIASYSDLTEGDYVVHANHGIGVYAGLERITFEGAQKDYIKILYAGGDALFVPCGQLDLVNKYIGNEKAVKVNKMGSSEWARAKAKAKSAAKDIAKELIRLYSARKSTPGFTFPADDGYQDEFESHFEYEETEDQLVAASEIKTDMEKPSPMDRLLCGDVGFGKTEVALRAIFKCVSAGKQAALLVPTTILALQHYRTLISRFRLFPVEIESISRFKTKKECDGVVSKLKNGKADIVVGTHKLLQKNIDFKDLGLLVVDEEQRFGVRHKERLKELAKNVDVLTLTATPIPRTLNMALTGIRDMSVLEEAPRDRAPVQSFVLEYDEDVIDEAIRRELRRGGQAFYLYNSIDSIYRVASHLKKRFPDAAVAIGHGQMSKDELSAVWQAMVDGEIDILVCTTIIETGVDIPNANTLIIEDADRFGLSQLHQIRGRVGRSPRKAYAYFTYKRGAVITELAAKRLEAVKEFTQFGSGFKIAMRDLEIRGAGNLLGSEQSGHLDAIGYDLYVKILEEAVNEEKGIVKSVKKECVIEVAVDAYIPADYVSSPKTRIDFYRKIALIDNKDDAEDLIDEITDRFGKLPPAVKNLIDISLCRNAASQIAIEKITQTGSLISFFTKRFDVELLSTLTSNPKLKGRFYLSPYGKPHFSVKVKSGEESVKIIGETLTAYAEVLTN